MVTGAPEMNFVKSKEAENNLQKQGVEAAAERDDNSLPDATDEVAEAKAQPDAVCVLLNPLIYLL